MADHAEGTHGHNMSMGTQARLAMLRTHHRQTLWVYWSIVMLGAWLVCAPWTFGYGHTLVVPTDGRDAWLSLEARAAAMRVSDLLSGLALLFFGWRALRPNRPASLWICCLVGIWLSLAPVVFWAPTPVAYLNDTLVGMAVIALSILIPGMPT